MDAAAWDEKYAAKELVYGTPPNAAVVDYVTTLPRGCALDLAAGEGRNALWLATRGWDVTAIDFSSVALTKGRRIAQNSPKSVRDRLTWVHADVTKLSAEPDYDLVLVLYLHLPPEQRRTAIHNAIRALKPDGILMILGHHSLNLTEGVGGPQELEILYTPEELASDIDGLGVVHRAENLYRQTDQGAAIDALLLASRSALGSGNERG
ncbi:class I SAM-dependent methyltransferase [Rhodococcus sp. PAMC28707]|uniref:class I SAM-dependent methyltransferase n=1 Tax=unclassified Rhodococcus (in: high G+C Gram-positive bacteria) TaxID=192944 RepID=UPI00109D8962|nr:MULTISPECIES: class I SAM-dependent methyltransferase [unclassified Rhodococcus (in: high G+C Gram-positive bacteria)]QCB49824.1 class I SAM-dependent methyltransferase [Rhodococcus sp. PAMC28705]QCB58483.1 class I SAM-dependent methyltransferase [Rhodococcus sp. PAMC28707]